MTRLASRAAVSLLARLAMAPQRAFGREEVASLLWPEADAATARARLRQTLSTLKALLEPTPGATVIVADRRVLRLAPAALGCDVPAFEQACRRGDAAGARRLYGGELLPGFYDDWIVDERQRLQALADRLPDEPFAPTPAPAPAPTLASTPADPAAALRVPARTESPLPRYLSALFGAEALLASCRERVLAHRLVTLVGPGGVGKTRLAVELAQRLHGAAEPFDMVRFVPWVGCRSAAEAGERLALTLGVDDGGDTLGSVTRALAGRRALLVLDNAEQLEPEALALVATLAARLGGLHLLLTSRRALALDGEQELHLDPLPTPAPGAGPEQALASPAVQLFVARARATRADFHLHAGNVAALVELARVLDGLPLALELAAARVRTQPPARLLALLRQPDDTAPAARWALLARPGPRAADDVRHASMLAVVDWSWRLLAPTQAALLRLLAFAPAAVEVTLAEQAALHAGVCHHAADARVLFDALAAASLLRRAPGADDRLWWHTPEPVADVAREHGDVTPTAAGARAAWRHALLDWAAGLPPTVPLREVDETLPAVLGALRQALLDGACGDLLRLMLALTPAWAERSVPDGALEALRQALARAPAGDPAEADLAARAQALAAHLCATAGRRAEALAHATTAQHRWPEAPVAGTLARVQVARVLWRCGDDPDAAERLLDAAEAVLAPPAAAPGAYPACGSAAAAVMTLRATLANEHRRDPAAAALLYRAALDRLASDPRHSAHVHRGLRYNLAITDIYAGRAGEALPRLEALRTEAEAADDRHLLAQVLNARGSALDAQGRSADAELATRDALAEAWRTLETENVLYALWNLAPLALARGDRPGADRAARLMGFADAFWRRNFGGLSPSDRRDVAGTRRRCRQRLGRAAGQAVWDAGAGLSLAAAVALALAMD